MVTIEHLGDEETWGILERRRYEGKLTSTSHRSQPSDPVNTLLSPAQKRPSNVHTEDQDVPTAFATVSFAHS